MFFLECIYTIIQTLELPAEFSMKSLSTKYIPCMVCMKNKYGEPQALRCKHTPECQAHTNCKCKKECSCYCDCKQFRYPSLTYSKIGAGLHMEFQEPDGSTFNIDCDLNSPSVPCQTSYDGVIDEIVQFLEEKRPVNWIEEISKLESMDEIALDSNIGKFDCPVKFRMINADTVLPRQVRVSLVSWYLLSLYIYRLYYSWRVGLWRDLKLKCIP